MCIFAFFYLILLWAPIVHHRTCGEWEAWHRKYPNGGLLLKPIGRIRLPCSLFYYITYSSFAPLVPSFAADFLLMPHDTVTDWWTGTNNGTEIAY